MAKRRMAQIVSKANRLGQNFVCAQATRQGEAFIEASEVMGISRASFYREWRDRLPIVEISARRRGVRASDVAAAIAARTRQPAGTA